MPTPKLEEGMIFLAGCKRGGYQNKSQNIIKKQEMASIKATIRVLLWCSKFRVWCCHYSGSGSGLSPGTSTCHRYGKGSKERRKGGGGGRGREGGRKKEREKCNHQCLLF